MNTTSIPRARGFTLIEFLAVIVVAGFLMLLVLPANHDTRRRSTRIQCVNNLKQLGISFRVAEGPGASSGPARLGTNLESARLYADLVQLSNVLVTPKVLVCPTDRRTRAEAGNWNAFQAPQARNRAISYFFGLGMDESQPGALRFGDRSLEARAPLPPFSYSAPRAVRGELHAPREVLNRALLWNVREMHRGFGQVGLGDGSVQMGDSARLRDLAGGSGSVASRNLIIQPGMGSD